MARKQSPAPATASKVHTDPTRVLTGAGDRQAAHGGASPDHQTTGALLSVIHDHPFCTLRQAMTYAGLERRAAATALLRLLEEGRVQRCHHRGRHHLIPDLPDLDPHLEKVKVLHDSKNWLLYHFVMGLRSVPRKDLLQQATTMGWKAEAARWQLRRLEDAGLIESFTTLEDRRCVHYRPLPLPAVVVRVLAWHHGLTHLTDPGE